jgi:hypothetical protein
VLDDLEESGVAGGTQALKEGGVGLVGDGVGAGGVDYGTTEREGGGGDFRVRGGRGDSKGLRDEG